MKKIPVLSFLLVLLALTLAFTPVSAQSGRTRTDSGDPQKKGQREEKPAPTPSPTPDNNAADIPSDDNVLNISTDLVSIPVSVFDRRGRYVFDLTKEEFQIFEDGKQQEITFFANTEQPFTVVLVLDVSLSTKFKINEIQAAAYTFISQLRPEDRVMVISFDEQIHILSEFTSDREQLKRAIRTAKFGDGTSLYDTVELVMDERLKRVPGRKAVVLFTDGVDTTSRKSYLEENLRDAGELDALIFPIQYDTYADVRRMERQGGIDVKLPGTDKKAPQGGALPPIIIDDDRTSTMDYPGKTSPNDQSSRDRRAEDPVMQNPGTTAKDYEVAGKYLLELADRTGGRVYRADNLIGLGNAFESIARELRQQYSVGYYPPNLEKSGVPRKIKVKVTRPDLVVKSRDTYTIGDSPTKKR